MALKIDGTTTRNPCAIADALANSFHSIPIAYKAVHRFQVPPDQGQVFKNLFIIVEMKYALQKAKG